ncbi:hypothetical protein YERSI8AC_290107 [Enterobacterales bacterium 8AC]|nr:hypothetical protein YERSI8AC_290107 [Enterobacterales bacterium 8AC]
MGTALANSWGGLAMARGAAGMAEVAMTPAGLKATSEWYPAKERSIAVGYFNVGSSIGGMLAPPLVVWVIVAHTWKLAFIIVGILSLIWTICWLFSINTRKTRKNSAVKNVPTSSKGKRRSTGPVMPKRCLPGRSCVTGSSGASHCHVFWLNRLGGHSTPGSHCSCLKLMALT